MASRLADLSRASEASQISFSRPPAQNIKRHPYKYGNPVSRIVGTSGKRLAISPTNNYLVLDDSSRADSQP